MSATEQGLALKRGARKAEGGKRKPVNPEPIGYRITISDSSEGWCLGILAVWPRDTEAMHNEYTERRYPTSEAALEFARRAILRANVLRIGKRGAK